MLITSNKTHIVCRYMVKKLNGNSKKIGRWINISKTKVMTNRREEINIELEGASQRIHIPRTINNVRQVKSGDKIKVRRRVSFH